MTTPWPTFRKAVKIVALVNAIALGACSDDPMVAAPRQSMKAKAPRGLYLSNPSIALLGVEVSGGELRQPLVYQFTLEDGAAKQSLSMPAGKGYLATVRGYDANGELTHEGAIDLEGVRVGENGALDLALRPVREGDEVKVSMDLLG